MKKLIILFVLFACCTANAQRLDSLRTQTLSDRDLGLVYLKKSRSQKTIGWIMLGAGTAAYIIGLSSINFFSENVRGADVAVVLGSFSMLGSIPLFISGAKNKGRAEILLRNQNIPLSDKRHKAVPSVGIRIALSR